MTFASASDDLATTAQQGKRSWFGIGPRIALGVAALVAFEAIIYSATSIYELTTSIEDEAGQRMELSALAAKDRFQAIAAVTKSYAEIYSRHGDIVRALAAGDTAALETFLVPETTRLRGLDSAVAAVEITDAKGIVVMRGHNPKSKGDNKAKVTTVAGALQGRTTAAWIVSPTSKELAQETVAPIKHGDAIIGTVKIGSYVRDNTAKRIADAARMGVAFFVDGKQTGRSGDHLKDWIPSDMSPLSLTRDSFGRTQIAGTNYDVAYIPLLDDQGKLLLTTALLSSRSTIEAALSTQLQHSILLGIGVTIVFVSIALMFALSVARPVSRLTGRMNELAGGDETVEIPDTRRSDELGAMAQALLVFRDGIAQKKRLESEAATARIAADAARAEREARETAAGREIAALCDQISNGNLTGRISESGKEGFLLDVSRQLNTLAQTLDGVTGEVAGVITGLADGDLRRQVQGAYNGVFGKLKDGANGTSAKLRDFASQLGSAADDVNRAAAEIAEISNELGSRTAAQASTLEETAAAMHEITTTVKQNADFAQNASQLSASASAKADEGGAVVGDAVTAVNDIESSARRISEIVSLIDEIAFQTNLLALNASVEAARAGETGKGFAVVAQEVRALAQRSANASKDIKSLIAESNSKVKSGATLVNQTGASLAEIVTAIKKASDIVADIAAGSREQATGVEQVNQAINSMDEATQRNAAMVEESSAAAQTLATQAQQLSQLVRFFKS
ncbi:MAG: methyl-accepting chemotaxis protein [Ferrovibrio sp.]|uniref:methyl-accepting chemotaxis protein n=1 Tax=Ferrovibrio sp. TaxID=1917215 RepID=UPI0026272550|nr:methyl-accepting chemotaxis protein [Ferrovibrio sp.]MCW0236030.1 methyl-accepting chemotaxis protein [Ferrovibrio sp.]